MKSSITEHLTRNQTLEKCTSQEKATWDAKKSDEIYILQLYNMVEKLKEVNR